MNFVYTQLASVSLVVMVSVAAAEDYFPTPIERGSLTVGIRDFAVLPDSDNGQPARMSVMTASPDGRLFVNDQRGPLYSISPDGATVTEYLDVDDFPGTEVQNASGEQGFQGFDFHPDFNNAGTAGYGKFYTIHSSPDTTPTPDFDPGGGAGFHSVLLEWSVDDAAAPTYSAGGNNTPRELLRFNQPFGNHNGGLVAFNNTAGPGDPDYGNLYVMLADGGSGGDPQENAQDTSNPYGSILRIDPLGSNSANGQYGIVADNALAADADENTLGEIYAYGLRNPQRFGWDSANGDMYIADIGQNDVEEIDLAANGGNFGWDQREGSFEFEGPRTPQMTDPVAEYDHTNIVADLPAGLTGGRAVTVGEVVRGSSIPGLDGNILLGDFPTGLMFYFNVDTDPLDGGQDGLAELVMLDEQDQAVRLIDLINQTRNANGLGDSSRADLRYSVGIEGKVFVLNKHDGVVRQLVPEPATLALLSVGGLLLGRRRRNGPDGPGRSA
jgi:hypothetical protein